MKRLLESSRPESPLPPGTRDATVRYRFDLREGGGWILKLDQGRLAVEAGEGGADGVVVCDQADVPKLLSGEMNLLTAWARGDIEVRGESGVLKLLHTYLRHAKGAERKKRAA
ncbi:MAG TPA: SCP2 sterol-binding domain-containing protein [Planctomycetota bacterium]